MSELKGIDISSWQADLDLSKISADFVIIKATGGKGYVNPHCDKHFQQAKKLGIHRGFYHFARDSGYHGTAIEEAQFFYENTKNYFHDAIPILDWESDNKHDTVWAKTWLDEVYRLSGVKPMIYMSASVENAYNWSAVAAADYGLWIAGYGANPQLNGYTNLDFIYHIKHWQFVAMWQYSSRTKLPGYAGNLDSNIFYGDSTAWNRYANKIYKPKSTPKPETPPVPKPAESKPAEVKPDNAPRHAAPPPPPNKRGKATYLVQDAIRWITPTRRKAIYKLVKYVLLGFAGYGIITTGNAETTAHAIDTAMSYAPELLGAVAMILADTHTPTSNEKVSK